MRAPTPESLDPPLQRYTSALLRLWWIPVVCALVCALLGGLVFNQAADDRATTTAVVSVSNPAMLASNEEPLLSIAPPNLVAEAARAESAGVAPQGVDDLSLAASPDSAAGALQFEVNGPDDETADVLGEWVASYREDRAARLAAEITALESTLMESRAQLDPNDLSAESLANFDGALASAAAVKNSPDAGVVMLDIETSPEAGGGALTFILFAIFGGAIGVAIVIGLTLRDKRVRTAGDLAVVGASPVIGTLATDGSGTVGAVIGSSLTDPDALVVIAGVDDAAAEGARATATSTATALSTAGTPVDVHDLDDGAVDLATLARPALVVAGRLTDHSGVLLTEGAQVALCAAHARSETLAAAIAAADVTHAGRNLIGIVLTGIDPKDQTSILSH